MSVCLGRLVEDADGALVTAPANGFLAVSGREARGIASVTERYC
ncbi:hypothetical protein [Microbacterium sp. 18062]|nr:hypothetical protein [Microbacterium sp. 18062]